MRTKKTLRYNRIIRYIRLGYNGSSLYYYYTFSIVKFLIKITFISYCHRSVQSIDWENIPKMHRQVDEHISCNISIQRWGEGEEGETFPRGPGSKGGPKRFERLITKIAQYRYSIPRTGGLGLNSHSFVVLCRIQHLPIPPSIRTDKKQTNKSLRFNI